MTTLHPVLHRLRLFLELIRFSHTVFALPFAFVSALLAWQTAPFRWLDLLGIILCMVFARSAAMAFNRLVDRRLDAENPRTAKRHLPAGLLSVPAVSIFFLISAAGFVGSTFLFANPWPLRLAGPVLLFICAYSLTKRFTILAHFWLGASLMLAPIAAWIALRGIDDLLIPSVLGLAVFTWVAGFDILYACQDIDVDRKLGLKSIPAALGVPRALAVARASHALTAIFLVALYFVAAPLLGWIYLTGVALAIALLIYEHWLVRADDLGRVNQAFFQVNAVISIGLFLLVAVQLVAQR